jgi:starch-binding outer membrane protein, SusD/RagB family
MKKIFISLCIISMFFTSCEDALNVDPQESVDATEALNTSQKVESAVIGLYAMLDRPSLYGTNFSLLPELLAAEENVTWRGTFQSYREVYQKNMVAENTEASRTWINAYDAINLANNVLEAMDVVTDEELSAQLEGEAKFVRGILHFELVRLYAKAWNDGNPATNLGIPVVTTATNNETNASRQVSRNTVQEVYTQIISDLTAAETLLPEENGSRANTFAASAFLARVYLQQGDYANARDKANRVIEEGPYNLNPTVTSAFMNDNTAESIFEIQQNDQNNAGNSNDGLSTFYASLVGIGRGDVQIVSFFEEGVFEEQVTVYDLYEDDDTRKTDLFYLGVGRRPDNIYTSKWTSPGQNIPIIRLAEMLLIRAEANLREGTTVGATPLDDINLIRERAGASNLGSVTLDDIILERQLELAFEGQRIHDIKRLELDLEGWMFDEDLETYVPDYTISWNDPTLVFPVPQREIDANSALSGQQNPGY